MSSFVNMSSQVWKFISEEDNAIAICILWFDLSEITYFRLIHTNFDTFRDIPR